MIFQVRKIILGQLFFKAGSDFVSVAGWLKFLMEWFRQGDSVYE